MEIISYQPGILFALINLHAYPVILLGTYLIWYLKQEHRAVAKDYLESLNILTCIVGLVYTCTFLWFWFEGIDVDAAHEFTLSLAIQSSNFWSFLGYFMLKFTLLVGFLKLSLRRNFAYSFVLSIVLWFEAIIIIVTSLHQDFLPSSFSFSTRFFVSILCYAAISYLIYGLRKRWNS